MYARTPGSYFLGLLVCFCYSENIKQGMEG